jgi:hypothetical protein
MKDQLDKILDSTHDGMIAVDPLQQGGGAHYRAEGR